jgi:hypothetical protein
MIHEKLGWRKMLTTTAVSGLSLLFFLQPYQYLAKVWRDVG